MIAANAPFVWGDGGGQLTPDAIARYRKVAEAMGARGGDYSPVQSWTQGAARVAEGLLGGAMESRALGAERANAAADREILEYAIKSAGGGSAAAPSNAVSPIPSGPAPTSPVWPGESVSPATPGDTARNMAWGGGTNDQAALISAAEQLGVKPVDLAAAISYETGGTFSPSKWGGKGGNYMGLIQFGPNERAQFGANPSQSFAEQVTGPVVGYLKGRGLPPGADLATIYRTINGGNPRASLNASDGNGTIAQHIARIQSQHMAPAEKFLGGQQVASLGGAVPSGGSPAAMPAANIEQQAAMSQAEPSWQEASALPNFAPPTRSAPQASPGATRVAQAMPGMDPRIMGAMASPYVSDGTKRILGIMLQNQLSQQGVTTVDLGNAIGIMDKRGNILRQIPKGEPVKGAEFGVIGKDEFGNEQYGWRDPKDKSVTPFKVPQQQPAQPAPMQPAAQPPAPGGLAGQSAAIPPAPPGVNPKVWRDTVSKDMAERAVTQPKKDEAAAKIATIVTDDIDRAIKTMDNATLPTTGAMGSALSYIGGTAAHDVSNLVNTVKANAGFAELQKMRDNSPTGGALGQVSERELTYLQSTIGSLEQSQSAGQFRDNLRRVKNAYLDIIHGAGKGPEREKLSFKDDKAEGWKELPGGVRIRMKP